MLGQCDYPYSDVAKCTDTSTQALRSVGLLSSHASFARGIRVDRSG